MFEISLTSNTFVKRNGSNEELHGLYCVLSYSVTATFPALEFSGVFHGHLVLADVGDSHVIGDESAVWNDAGRK